CSHKTSWENRSSSNDASDGCRRGNACDLRGAFKLIIIRAVVVLNRDGWLLLHKKDITKNLHLVQVFKLYVDYVQNFVYICHFGNVLRFLAGAAKPPSAPPCGALPRIFIRQESPYIPFVSFFTHYVGRNLYVEDGRYICSF